MLYEGLTVYGPYVRKDGRKHVVLQDPATKKLKTVSYPKYLMELHLDRYLEKDETVDHIDRDFTNDSLSNLVVLSRSDHVKLDAIRLVPQTFTCPVCISIFTIEGKSLGYRFRDHKVRESSGPYCSRSCAGIASHWPKEKRNKKVINKQYYQLAK